MPTDIDEYIPNYLQLHKNGTLKQRGEALLELMQPCKLCPRMCGVSRLNGERGECSANNKLEISSFSAHFGEEEPLVGNGGSGTIFMTHCSLKCMFCINWDIAHIGHGFKRTIEDFADIMLSLQSKGCVNINIVTPTHYSPYVVLALDLAASKGLNLPLVYNTCGWERIEVLKILDGIVDIYLPDFKYTDTKNAALYSYDANTYVEYVQNALLEMHRQVGIAITQKNGLIKRGLMIRHLVMPNDVSGSKDAMLWISENLPKNTYINLMSQYRPMYKANKFPKIARPITQNEYKTVVDYAVSMGLVGVELQGYIKM